MNRFIKLAFCFLIPFAFCFCKKTNDDSQKGSYSAYFTSDTKAWYFYKTGSKWVYQNDSSNVSDSIVVDSSSIILYDATKQYPTELLFTHYKSNGFGIIYTKMSARAGCDPGVLINYSNLYLYYAFPGFECAFDTVGRVLNFYDQQQKITGYRKIVNFYPNYLTQAGSIPNVYEIEINDFVLNKIIKLFIAKNYGIIKQQYIDSIENSSWTVTSMKIIQ